MESRLGRAYVVYGETWELQNLEFIHYLSEVMIELSVFEGMNSAGKALAEACREFFEDGHSKVEIRCFIAKNSESEDGLPSILTNL